MYVDTVFFREDLMTMKTYLWWTVFVLGLAGASSTRLLFGAVSGPYTVDSNTTHLWHFNDFTSPTSQLANNTLAADAVTGSATYAMRSSYWHLLDNSIPLDERAVATGTTLGNASFSGFGFAADNRAANSVPPSPTFSPGTAVMGLYPNLDPGTATNDNVPLPGFFGTNGAFTIEGMYRVNWDPTQSHDAPYMMFMTMEEDSSTALGLAPDGRRTLEFYLDFSDGGASATNPRLAFDSRTSGNPDVFSATLGTLEQGAWYHVAATFNGVLGQTDNFKMYMTKVEGTATQASVVAQGTWNSAIVTTGSTDVAIGNNGRTSTAYGAYPGEPWFGLFDEVRISNVARGAGEFIFTDSLLPGDVDGLNGVDINDFYIISDHFLNTGATKPEGDLNLDTVVDILDFRIWKNNYVPPGSGAGAFFPGEVPEPASLLLLALCGLLPALGWRRRT